MKLRVLFADDERPARSYLASLLHGMDDVDIAGEAASGVEAVPLIERVRPDLVLLDVHMPGLDGFETMALLELRPLPLVAFVTAHDAYAVRAFEAHAIDYLLKPVRRARLRETLQRAREKLEHRDLRDEETARVQAAGALYTEAKGGYLERLPVRRKHDIVIVAVRDIASLVTEHELLVLTTVNKERFVLDTPLREIEGRLDPARFVRLSRSALANLDVIARVEPLPGGLHTVHLSNGQQIHVSRQHSRVLRARVLDI